MQASSITTLPDLEVLKLLGEALALGLLVGVERYRDRQPGEKTFAGVRTFSLFCLSGALCGVFATPGFTAVTFAAVAALVVLGYHRSPSESIGATTEMAALLVFWLGYLLTIHEVAAISLGIVLTILLASKQLLHHFVKAQISEVEFEATLKFLAVVLVIYPILPDRSMGPYGFFNPRQIWGLVILVSTISYGGYLLMRWFGRRRGLLLGSLVGGIVSTTAVTTSLAGRARAAPDTGRLMGAVAVGANAVQGPRLLLLLWIVDRTLARAMAAPLLAMAVVGFLGAWILTRRVVKTSDPGFPLRNPYSFGAALKFGLFFTAILLLVEFAGDQLGDRGTLIASAIAGTGSTSAVALSVADLDQQAGTPLAIASLSIMIAIATNALTKWFLAWTTGTRRMALWLGGGLATMLVAAFLVLWAGV